MKKLISTIFLIILVSGCSSTGNVFSSKKVTSEYTLKSGGELKELQKELVVKHVELHFEVFPKKKKLAGKAIYTFETNKSLTKMSLDLDRDFTINQIKYNNQVLVIDNYQNPQGELIITMPEQSDKIFTLSIDYEGKPHVAKRAPWDGGFVWSKTPDGHDWIATAVQLQGCDLFWPCIDHPLVEPETADIYITVDKTLVAASNGILQGVKELNNKKTYHWRTLTPINNYAFSLNIGPYEEIKDTYQSIYGNTLDLVYYHLPRQDDKPKKLFAEIPVMLDFFERVIGPFPFSQDKVGIVETPHLGMEHQTINAYGNNYRKTGFGFDQLLQHEFAHEWFANQLTNNNPDHMWLQEGFGSYMQPLFAQYLQGERGYLGYLKNSREGLINKFPLVSNKAQTIEEVYGKDKGPSGDIYAKGSLVLHTLRQLIGDQFFFTSIRELVYGTADPKPGNFKPRISDTQEFIQIVNDVTGKDYQWFFDVYVFQAPLPILEQERENSQIRLNWKTENDLSFPMPLDVSINGEIKTLAMQSKELLIVHPKDIVIIDPMSKILRQEKAIDDFQAYKKKNEKKQK